MKKETTVRSPQRVEGVCGKNGLPLRGKYRSRLPFDGLMYRETVMVAVRLKKVRYGIGDNCIIQQKFPDDLRAYF